MGRWRSGTSLVDSPDRDDPELAKHKAKANSFLYLDGDRDGHGLPGVVARPPCQPARRSRRHRRGVVRGGAAPPHPPPRPLVRHAAAVPAGARDRWGERAARPVLISLQSSIARGFEFIEQTWLSAPGFNTIPADPVRLRLPEVPRFVTTRGGGYFFMPSRSALYRIAQA